MRTQLKLRWHSVYSSAKAQQSSQIQSSCRTFHTLIDICSQIVPDFCHQDPWIIPWEIIIHYLAMSKKEITNSWINPIHVPQFNGFFSDLYFNLSPSSVEISTVVFFVILLTNTSQPPTHGQGENITSLAEVIKKGKCPIYYISHVFCITNSLKNHQMNTASRLQEFLVCISAHWPTKVTPEMPSYLLFYLLKLVALFADVMEELQRFIILLWHLHSSLFQTTLQTLQPTHTHVQSAC